MLQIAEGIENRGIYSPLFLFTWEDGGRSIKICRERGYQYSLQGISEQSNNSDGEIAKPVEKPTQISRWTSVTNRVKIKLKNSFAVMFLFYLIQFLKIKHFVSNFLSEKRVVCLVLIGDRHIGIETALVREGNLWGIPSLIVPFGFADEESSFVYRQALHNWQKIYGMTTYINRFIANIKPEWTYTHKGETLLWNPPSWLISASITGLMPNKPWTLGGGAAWYMSVESQYHKDSFCKQGVPRRKLFISGKPRYDSSAEMWKNQKTARSHICQEMNIDVNKPILVCSVPQMGEHDLLPWPEHWDEIDFLFSSLGELQPDVNVLLSLHPKSDFSQYEPRAKQYGLMIAQNHSYDQLIPVCDVFLATFSSTVTLAIACQKPTIVIDFYSLNYDIFDDMAGIVVCRKHEDMIAVLNRLFNDDEYFQQMVAGQTKSAEYWARFDGKSTERILDEIDLLIDQGKTIQKLPRRQRRKKLPPWSQ